jgi:hypothetical protein
MQGSADFCVALTTYARFLILPSRVQRLSTIMCFPIPRVISTGASVDRKHLAADSEGVFETGGQKWHPGCSSFMLVIAVHALYYYMS